MSNRVFLPNSRAARLPYFLCAISLHLLFAVTLWPMLTGPLSAAPEPLSFTVLGRIADHPWSSLLTLAGATPLAGAPTIVFATAIMFAFIVLSLNRLRDADRSFHWIWLALGSSALLMTVLMFFPTVSGAARSTRAV